MQSTVRTIKSMKLQKLFPVMELHPFVPLKQIFKAKLREQHSRWTLKWDQLDALADNCTTDLLVWLLFISLFISVVS